jgi:hypothetical protein
MGISINPIHGKNHFSFENLFNNMFRHTSLKACLAGHGRQARLAGLPCTTTARLYPNGSG